MALINHRAREIHFKIVYYGPSLGGKTTNLKVLHERLPADRRGKLLSIATDHERTLFFDFLPFALGQIQGYTTRIHLYTTPGQAYYRLSRRAVLQGLDGLVFVADSHPARESANRESLEDLHEHLTALGVTPEQRAKIGWIFQYNKRDLANALPVERLRRALNPHGAPEFESSASTGTGVAETLRAACKAVISQVTIGDPQRPVAAPAAAPAAARRAPARPVAAFPSIVPAATAATPAPAAPITPAPAPPAVPAAAPRPRTSTTTRTRRPAARSRAARRSRA